ncbi:electron transport protein SCO1/SenC [Ketogulonicigenium robustum]|uniref:Electron transport protein SCO1/SenC n=1 Tax=Ketogulonicigenium robustum TaxID=92947 RepID=A0A1W6NWG2_9RHOB|nr:SCO family protein [Ketogulonicigenium robustum]ARO13544.1 electron transport protein SCO1/SenC [Ketogulonicigenium robustum]
MTKKQKNPAPSGSNKTLRNVRIAIWALALVAGAGAVWMVTQQQQTQSMQTAYSDIGQGDYNLVTTTGEPFTAASLRGQPSLVFFGFTHCPDVCPTTLGDITLWKDELGNAAKDLKVVFITVDPERDTPELLHDYVSWVPDSVGVTGTPDEVAKAVSAFRIYASKVPLENGDYTMNHAAYVMLFDENGQFNQIFSYQEDIDRVTQKLRDFL